MYSFRRCKNQWNKLNGKGRYVMPADKKPRPQPNAIPAAPPATIPGKRSHHKKALGISPRKHRKVSTNSSSSSATSGKPELVIKVPARGESLHLLDVLDGENTTVDGDLNAETDYYSDDDDDDAEDSRENEDFSEDYSYAGLHDRSLAVAQERQMQVDESEVDDSYGSGPGNHLLDDFNLDNEPEAGHEIPTSGDSHLPAPFAWTDPQLPVEEPVSTEDLEGVANEAGLVASWGAEAEEAQTKQVTLTLTLKTKHPQREEDTPQVDRKSQSSTGNDPSQLRLDMSGSTDFFANPEQGEYMHDILPTPRRRSHEEMIAVKQNDPMSNWVPAKYRS